MIGLIGIDWIDWTDGKRFDLIGFNGLIVLTRFIGLLEMI
jgi:hypothetical protein